ncbi:hypothetical protein A3B57_04170 [Microgenomates group bacterium RIFCSPLOWO2_01_FULL_47_10]|nr:MAG: hypothetical protein A3B57_04170 [Microgenomates group bacterium RIFCSPLOWO2_01_FULL_47_10]
MLELNICLLPNKKVSDECIRLSQSIAKPFDGLFILDNKTHHPHLSLYHFGIPNKNLSHVKAAAKQLIGKVTPFTIHLFKPSQDKGFIEVSAVNSLAIKKLQRAIINTINPLREGLQRPGMVDLMRQSTTDSKTKNNIEQFGYPYIRSAFKPHITLTRLAGEQKAKTITRELQIAPMRFMSNKIGLALIGQNGTCPKIITIFRVQS